jgi:hypothetical protein
MMRKFALAAFIFMSGMAVAQGVTAQSDQFIAFSHKYPTWAKGWSIISAAQRASVADDDIARHSGDPQFWDGIAIAERRFSEAGFDWHLLRFTNLQNPYNVIWVVPHDDENGAFEGGIAALKKYGGMLIVVNSGPGSLRRQAGRGTCGGRPSLVRQCDPNRNFSAATPLFTSAFLDHRTEASQPVIALHTNGAGAAGDFSLLDIDAYKKARVQLRKGAHRAVNPTAEMDNYDTLGLIAYPAKDGGPNAADIACRNALNNAGIHFWHERVDKSDGSLSNYLALERPDIPYFNAESREETDLSVSASRHLLMIDAYLRDCVPSRNKPLP